MSEEQSLCHDHCIHDHQPHDHDHHDHEHEHEHEHEEFFKEEPEPYQHFPWITFIMQTQDFKQAAILAVLYLALAIQALWFGLTSSSVHLTEESFDCALNSIVIGFAIYCGIKAKTYQTTKTYPFGMERLEYLSAFTLCIHICILTMFQLSRNAHEILEDLHVINHPISDQHEQNANSELYYATLRIVLSFIGIFLFVEYIQPNFSADKEQFQQFVYNFKNVIPAQAQRYYYTHYLNMHAITMLLLCELLFNIGTFLECMLDNTLSFAAIGTIIAVTNTIILIIQLTPLVQTSIYALLLATNEKFEGIKQSIEPNQLYIWNHGADYNAIIITEGTKKREIRAAVKDLIGNKFRNCYVHVQ